MNTALGAFRNPLRALRLNLTQSALSFFFGVFTLSFKFAKLCVHVALGALLLNLTQSAPSFFYSVCLRCLLSSQSQVFM